MLITLVDVDIYANFSKNNTRVVVTDSKGKILIGSSGGKIGFKGRKQSSPYVAQLIIENLIKKLKAIKILRVTLKLKGFGPGREILLKLLYKNTIFILTKIIDITPVIFNGCRPKKPRRI